MISNSLEKKLKSRKIFEIVYKNGTIVYSKDKLIRARYYLSDKSQIPELKIAVSVSSKAGGAVWRNRIKRLMNESIRTKKKQLSNIVSGRKLCLLVVFSPNSLNQQNSKGIKFNVVNSVIPELLDTIERRIKEL
jgi:ribonuclease P protein component